MNWIKRLQALQEILAWHRNVQKLYKIIYIHAFAFTTVTWST